MKHVKRLLSLLLVTAMTLSLCSCGLFAARVGYEKMAEQLEKEIDTLQNYPSMPTLPAISTPYTPKTIDIPLCEEAYAIGVNKNNPALLNQVNAFITQSQQDSVLNDIFRRYIGDGTPVPVTSMREDSGKDQLIVATSTGFEPFDMVSQGRYYGIDMEIAAALAEYLGKELVIKDMAFSEVVDAVQKGTCDVAIAALTPTAERSAKIDFSHSYYISDQMLVVPVACTLFDGCRTAADVVALLSYSGYTVGYHSLLGDAYINGDAESGFGGLPVTDRQYSTVTRAIEAMQNGEVDCILADRSAIHAVLRS